jgi:hypothetical protein
LQKRTADNPQSFFRNAQLNSDIMKNHYTKLAITMATISLLIITAVCWHSVEEIHYLKSFFPQQFTVQEAFYASGIELIKITIISLPLLLVIGVSLYVLRHFRNNR